MARIWLCIFVACLWAGCQKREKLPAISDQQRALSLAKRYQDTSYIDPGRVVNVFEEERKKMRDSIASYQLLHEISLNYFYENRIQEAFDTNRRVLEFCSRTRKDTLSALALMAKAYNCRGIFWLQKDRRDSARICYEQAYITVYRTEERILLPDICINLADCHQFSGAYVQASANYRKALLIADSLGIGDLFYYPIYSGMARLYMELNNFSLADHYFDLCEPYAAGRSDYEKYYFASTRGNYYYNTGEYEKALDWFRRADTLAVTFPQQTAHALTIGNIGEIFMLLNLPDSARRHLDVAGRLLAVLPHNESVDFYMRGLYGALALQQNRLSEAEQLLSEPFDTAQISPQYIYYYNRRMQTLFARKNDFEKAYRYGQMANAYNDSISNARVQHAIAEIDSRYRQDTTLLRKDLVIAQIQSRAARWKRVAYWGSVCFVVLLLLAGYVTLYRARQREKRYNRQRMLVARLRMEIVRNRISPHYIFNVLNAVMPTFRQYKELVQPIKILVRMLRESLVLSEHIALALDQEITFVKEYLQLRMLSNPRRIRVEWDVDGAVPLHMLVPSMCIQIPVENAVKYAFGPDCTDATLQISLSVRGEYLHIAIQDNGVGFAPAAGEIRRENGTGNGLKILYRTIELLNTQNLQKIRFEIENLSSSPVGGQGTRVTIVVPLHYIFDL